MDFTDTHTHTHTQFTHRDAHTHTQFTHIHHPLDKTPEEEKKKHLDNIPLISRN